MAGRSLAKNYSKKFPTIEGVSLNHFESTTARESGWFNPQAAASDDAVAAEKACALRTLVVEDQRDLRMLVRDHLLKRGHEVLDVEDAESAWDEHLKRPFQFVVLDVMLPGIDGLELCRRMRELPGGDRVVVLICTGRTSAEDLQAALDAGANDFLAKPFSVATLRTRIVMAERLWQTIDRCKRAELAAQENAARFTLAADGTSDGFWDAKVTQDDWKSPSNEVWYSPIFKRMLGYKNSEFPHVLGSWIDCLVEDDREHVFAALQAHFDAQAPFDCEYRVRTKSGEVRWLQGRGQSIWDDNGRPIRMAGSIRDITESRSKDMAIRESEARYRLLAENSTDIISRHQLDGSYIYASPATMPLLGYRPDDLIGTNIYQFLHPEDIESVRQAHRAVIECPEPMTAAYRIRHKEGHYVWLETSAKRTENPEKFGAAEITCVSRDVTQRMIAEEALIASEEKWRTLVENAPDYIVTTDTDGVMTFANRTTPGLPMEQVIGKDIYHYAPPDAQLELRKIFDSVLQTGKPAQFEVAGIGPHGSVAWYMSRFGPIITDGRVTEIVVISTDITERKQIEQALTRERGRLQKLLDLHESERQLIAYEIHDGLVQDLTGASMHLDASTYLRETEPERSQVEYERSRALLRGAIDEARRLISGMRPPILDESGIVAALEYLVNESREEIEVEFVHDQRFARLAPPLETAIFRVVQEALSNVRHHSHSLRARVELSRRTNKVRVEVQDWGSGFDEGSVREGAFGLEGIRERARLLGGNAQIISAPGKGTMVIVELPLLQSESAR